MRGGDGARVLVIGSTGQVGLELVAELARRPASLDVVGASRSNPNADRRVSLEQPDTIDRVVRAARPNHVILTAAATNVGWCEQHPDASRVINVEGTQAAALAAHQAGASFTFISSDYVFDGSDGPYPETASTHPINVYGAHKLEAEAAAMAANAGNLIVRTCQVFGDDPRRTNFVVRVVDRLRRGERVEAASDLFGTPTYAPDLARALAELTLTGASGIWNVVGETYLSRYELAKMAAAAFGCERDAIVEVTSDQMDDPVNRPRRSGLRNDRLATTGLRLITPLEQALAELARGESQD